MAETELVQRVDSAEMADLFSSAFLADDEDFLSPTRQSLTHDDVRNLRLKPEGEARRSLAPVRVGESTSELHLRARGEEDAWLVNSERQHSVARSDSVENYLKLQDAKRPSFSKRPAGVCAEGDRHAKGFAKQAGCKEPQRDALSGRRPGHERRGSLGGCSDKSAPAAYDRCPSAGGRRKKTPSPALTSRSSLEGRDPLMSRGSSSCATPTPTIDPPYSPCSSSCLLDNGASMVKNSRIPTPKNGRSRIPSPTLSECRSNVSSPAQSDPHSRFSSPTPSERSLRREGYQGAVARPHSAIGYPRRQDSCKTPSSMSKPGHRGQKSWSAGPGSDCDPFSPKSSVSECGHVSLSDDFGQMGSPYAEGEDNKGIPKQKLFNGGLSKLQKEAARKADDSAAESAVEMTITGSNGKAGTEESSTCDLENITVRMLPENEVVMWLTANESGSGGGQEGNQAEGQAGGGEGDALEGHVERNRSASSSEVCMTSPIANTKGIVDDRNDDRLTVPGSPRLGRLRGSDELALTHCEENEHVENKQHRGGVVTIIGEHDNAPRDIGASSGSGCCCVFM